MQILKASNSVNASITSRLAKQDTPVGNGLNPKPQSSSPAAIIRLSSSAALNPQSVVGNQTMNLSMTLSTSNQVGWDRRASITRSASDFGVGAGNNYANANISKVKVSVNLVKGESYSPSASTGYVYSGKVPKMQLSVTDAADKVVFKSTKNTGSFIAKTSGTHIFTWELTNPTTSVFTSFTGNLSSKSLLPTTSGDKNIDALLMGGANNWWHAPGSGAEKSTNASDLIKQGLYSLASGSSFTSLKYSFLSSAPDNGTADDKREFTTLSSSQKNTVKAAFDYIASITKLSFEDVTVSGADANIYFGANTQVNSNGYAYLPNSFTSAEEQKTYLYLNKNIKDTAAGGDDAIKGSYGWQTVFHEIGHALGLKHPGNYNAGTGNSGAPKPYLKATYDNQQYSIMSYNDTSYTSSANNRGYMLYDVAALQYLYGIKANGSTADTGSFNFSNSSIRYLETIWSLNDTDKIDLTGLTSRSRINLNAGTYSSINMTSDSVQNNVAIGYGSKINNVKLTTAGNINEEVILNAAFKSSKHNVIENLTSGDTIGISKSIFGKISSSNIQITNNHIATSKNTKILVNTDTRDIYYDPDGSGRKEAVKIAAYTGHTLNTSNFSFVA
jgi:hypothetical protein